MIRNRDITIQTGLQERRLYQLAKTQSEKELIGLIGLQLQDLIEFLGLNGKMTAKQIFDTAEFILDKHGFFSLRALQHCFNMVKNSEKPFDKPLYNAINGKKILEWLNKYHEIVDEYLFADANSKVYTDHFRATERTKQDDINRAFADLTSTFGRVKDAVRQMDLPNRKFNVTETKLNPKK